MFVVALAFASACFASVADDVSLAQQWEERGNFKKAGYHYDQAAQKEVNLNKRAKLHQLSLKAYLKTDDFNSIEEAANRVRQYAKDGGESLLRDLAPNYLEAGKRQAQNYNNTKAYELLSYYLAYHPSARNKLADDFYAKGNKELAYQLNSTLKSFDCKDLLGRADRATKDDDIVKTYSSLLSACPGQSLSFEDQQRIGKRVLDAGKKIARIPGKEDLTTEARRIVRLFLGEAVIVDKFAAVERLGIGIFPARPANEPRMKALKHKEVILNILAWEHAINLRSSIQLVRFVACGCQRIFKNTTALSEIMLCGTWSSMKIARFMFA